MKTTTTVIFSFAMVLSVVFVGEISSTGNNPFTVSAQGQTIKRTSRNVGRRTARGGRWVVRKTWNGSRWVTRKVWVPTKRTGQQAWRGTKKLGRSIKRAVN